MRVSVITVNLNDLKGLKATVESVIGQTYVDFEYIVVDGASTDGSKEYIAGTERIDQWMSEPDTGIYNAMNKAIALAHGDYCIFMNAGDTFYDSKVLEEVVPQLDDADFYVGATFVMAESKNFLKEALKVPLDLKTMLTCMPCHQSTFTRTALLKERCYREDLKIISDWEMFFHCYYFHDGNSYVPMKTTVSVFHYNGLSWVCREKVSEEVKQVALEVFPKRIVQHILHKEGLEKKIEVAMAKSPLARDWKLIRNAFKYLIKDIFVALKP
ncbi:MAG: glycosyltransferase [Paraprevotella sp.]|nr:glycosyltransferase [Paraprevotella sp.]